MSLFGFGKKKAKAAATVAASLVAASAPATARAPDAPRAAPASVKAQAGALLARHQTGVQRFLVTQSTARRLGASPEEATREAFKDFTAHLSMVARHEDDLLTTVRLIWEGLG